MEASRPRRPTLRLPEGMVDAVGLWAAMRLILGLAAVYVIVRGGVPGPCHFELARNGWLTIPPLADQGPAFPLVGVWQRWDACWYTKIAAYWYEPQELSVNFWPLFPLLTAGVSKLVGGSVALAGLIVSGIAYIAAMVGLYRLVKRDVDEPVARRTMLFVTVFPSAFFLFAPFTEATFLALAVWTMVAARERRFLAALVLGVLVGLTRTQGVFLALPIGWEALAAGGLLAWRPWRSLALPTIRWRELVRGVLGAAGPVVGFVGYLQYSFAIAGETPLTTQDAWGGREFHWPWEVAQAAWSFAFERQEPMQLVNLGLLALFLVLLVVVWRRLPFSYLLYALPQVALLATRLQPTPLTSTSRLLIVVFPVLVVLAMIPWQRVRIAWAFGSAGFLALLLYDFVRGNFIA